MRLWHYLYFGIIKMAYINLIKALFIGPETILGRELYNFCEANPVPVSSRIVQDTYPSRIFTNWILKNVPARSGNFFDHVLHALSFYIGGNEIYVAYHTDGDTAYISCISYNENLRLQNKAFQQRAVLSSKDSPATNIQRLRNFLNGL